MGKDASKAEIAYLEERKNFSEMMRGSCEILQQCGGHPSSPRWAYQVRHTKEETPKIQDSPAHVHHGEAQSFSLRGRRIGVKPCWLALGRNWASESSTVSGSGREGPITCLDSLAEAPSDALSVSRAVGCELASFS